ncbi:hypothetical protein Dimus_014162 [Dionaea muscipula]
MSRERRSCDGSSARISGDCVPVINRSFRHGNVMNRGRGNKLISLFVEDIQESMEYVEMKSLFAKFGVESIEQAIRLIGYECSVAADVAIQKSNGLWIKDKELKVKLADFHKHKGGVWQRKDDNTRKVPGRVDTHIAQPMRTTLGNARNEVSTVVHRLERSRLGPGGPLLSRVRKSFSTKESYANVVRKGPNQQESIPTIKVDTIGNGWLYRSVVASLDNHRFAECLLESLTERDVGTFCCIDNYWGEVVQIEEDTTKCARVDMGKIKIFTYQMATINQVMRLLVGTIPFDIRVVEEQAVFICNSDFRYGCLCHAQADEHTMPADEDEDGDDVEGKEADQSWEDVSSRSVSVVANSQFDNCAPGDGIATGNAEGFMLGSEYEGLSEPDVPVVAVDEQARDIQCIHNEEIITLGAIKG